MSEIVQELIERLRDELKNYGEMLALLDRQQEFLRTRAASEVSSSVSLIQAQGALILEAREQRENCRRAAARAAGQDAQAPFAELIPVLPGVYQPLLEALVDENNELLLRVRRRARQNHLMLKRSVESMREVLQALSPSARAGQEISEINLPAMRPWPDEPLREADPQVSEIPVESHAQN